MPVTMTIPGSGTENLQGRAFKPEVMVANLAGKGAVLKSLRSADAFDIKIGTNNFRFFLTGFANALPAFDKCMGQAQPDAAPAPMAQAPATKNTPLKDAPEETTMVEAASVEVEAVKPVPVVQEKLAHVSKDEPMRDAPSAATAQRQKEEIEKYEQDLARLNPKAQEERVTENLQKEIEASGKIPGDTGLNKKPETRAERYTSMLAAQMGTEIAQESALIQNLPPTATKPAAMAAQDTPSADVSEQSGDIPAAIAETMAPPLDDVPSPVKVSEQVATNSKEEMPAITEPVKTEQGRKSLLDDLKDFVMGDEAPADTAIQNAAVKEDVTLVQSDDEEVAVFVDEPAPALAPEPVRTRTSTPEMKVTKETEKLEADFTSIDTQGAIEVDAAPAIPPSFGKTQREAELEKKLATMESENRALNAELNSALKASENELMEVSSDNWNLEQATMRYNETERQVSKLGQQIQKERAQCSYEKKELELMLFDPQMTENAQLAHLSSLEKKLEAAQKEIDSLKSLPGN